MSSKSTRPKTLTFVVSESAGKVSAILTLPGSVDFLLVLAHGAGAGMRHKFMEDISARLAERNIGTFRYQFPYMEYGRRLPDPKPVLHATVRAAIERSAKAANDIPLIAGGKSMGGRMTSQAAAETPLEGIDGIVFFGFPLHPPGRPGVDRAEHLRAVTIPMLFLQGTKDEFADLTLLKPLCKDLGRRSTLHLIDGGDHSFKVPRSSGKTNEDVMLELADHTLTWAQQIIQ